VFPTGSIKCIRINEIVDGKVVKPNHYHGVAINGKSADALIKGLCIISECMEFSE